MPEPVTADRADFLYWQEIPTRWKDNDVYGHMNNVEYYSMFDTLIGMFLRERGAFTWETAAVVGYAVESQCRFLRSIAWPDVIDAGLSVGHLGNSSVRYEIGLFRAGDAAPAAVGHFIHVFVDRASGRPQRIPDPIRAAMSAVQVAAPRPSDTAASTG